MLRQFGQLYHCTSFFGFADSAVVIPSADKTRSTRRSRSVMSASVAIVSGGLDAASVVVALIRMHAPLAAILDMTWRIIILRRRCLFALLDIVGSSVAIGRRASRTLRILVFEVTWKNASCLRWPGARRYRSR